MSDRLKAASLKISDLDFDLLKRSAERDPIGLINKTFEEQQALGHDVRHTGWRTAIKLYACACAIRADAAQWRNLQRHEVFKSRPRPIDTKKLLLHVMIAGTRSEPGSNAYKAVQRRAGKLQRFFDAKMSPDAALGMIEAAHGFHRLAGPGKRKVAACPRGTAGTDKGDAPPSASTGDTDTSQWSLPDFIRTLNRRMREKPEMVFVVIEMSQAEYSRRCRERSGTIEYEQYLDGVDWRRFMSINDKAV